MSKYRILAIPDFKPGKCANCGSSKNDGRQYIDFGLEVDWFGTVYLCGHCLQNIAESMGLFKTIQTQLIESELKNKSIDDLKQRGEELYTNLIKTIREFEEFYATLHSIIDSSGSDGSDRVVTSETTTESRTDEAEPRTSEQTSSTRRTDIPSLADLLNSDS